MANLDTNNFETKQFRMILNKIPQKWYSEIVKNDVHQVPK